MAHCIIAILELVEIFLFTIITMPAVIPGTRGAARNLEYWPVAFYLCTTHLDPLNRYALLFSPSLDYPLPFPESTFLNMFYHEYKPTYGRSWRVRLIRDFDIRSNYLTKSHKKREKSMRDFGPIPQDPSERVQNNKIAFRMFFFQQV